MMTCRKFLFAAAVCTAAAGVFALGENPTPGVGYNNSARYATDAYPGFDSEDEILKPERKEPRWFAFINGPNRENAADQFAYCQELVQAENYSKAAKQLDALVREWPTSREAPKAQQQYAEILLTQLDDTEEAFKAYRYLHDFYSLQCDYDAIADKLFQLAGVLREEGKEVMFIRFENVVDVRRAYETAVLHAPGAKWVPSAMLTIAELRVREGKNPQAIAVYENLRNLYPKSPEAKRAVALEASVRMDVLRECEYNRARCRDVRDYLKLALTNCREEDTSLIRGYLDEVTAKLEEDAFLHAQFYDSRTRTKHSAISAYEKFLKEYPESKHAEAVKERIRILKGGK